MLALTAAPSIPPLLVKNLPAAFGVDPLFQRGCIAVLLLNFYLRKSLSALNPLKKICLYSTLFEKEGRRRRRRGGLITKQISIAAMWTVRRSTPLKRIYKE